MKTVPSNARPTENRPSLKAAVFATCSALIVSLVVLCYGYLIARIHERTMEGEWGVNLPVIGQVWFGKKERVVFISGRFWSTPKNVLYEDLDLEVSVIAGAFVLNCVMFATTYRLTRWHQFACPVFMYVTYYLIGCLLGTFVRHGDRYFLHHAFMMLVPLSLLILPASIVASLISAELWRHRHSVQQLGCGKSH